MRMVSISVKSMIVVTLVSYIDHCMIIAQFVQSYSWSVNTGDLHSPNFQQYESYSYANTMSLLCIQDDHFILLQCFVTVSLYLSHASYNAGSIKHVCFTQPNDNIVYMIDAVQKRAVLIDPTNVHFSDLTKYNGQQSVDYQTTVEKLNRDQIDDLNTIILQTHSHLCVMTKFSSKFEFHNIDFNLSKLKIRLDSLPKSCKAVDKLTAYQYDPKTYHVSQNQNFVCASETNSVEYVDLANRFASVKSCETTHKNEIITTRWNR